MTDPTNRDEADETQDSRVAALLGVAPLDDVTRRRLVDAALRTSSRRRAPRHRYLAAAAIVVTGLVVAGGVLANGGDSSRPSARPAPSSSPETFNDSGAGADAPKSADRSAVAPTYLGDYGDLGDPARVARLQQDAVRSRSSLAAYISNAVPADLADLLAEAQACEVLKAPLLAVANGTLEARPTIVLVSETDVVVLSRGSCETRRLG